MNIHQNFTVEYGGDPSFRFPDFLQNALTSEDFVAIESGGRYFRDLGLRTEFRALRELLRGIEADDYPVLTFESTYPDPLRIWYGFTIPTIRERWRIRLPILHFDSRIPIPIQKVYMTVGGLLRDDVQCRYGLLPFEDISPALKHDAFSTARFRKSEIVRLMLFWDNADGSYLGYRDDGEIFEIDPVEEPPRIASMNLDEFFGAAFDP